MRRLPNGPQQPDRETGADTDDSIAIHKQYVGCNIETLGEIPDDPAVTTAIHAYMPVSEHAPASPAATVLKGIGENISAMLEPKR